MHHLDPILTKIIPFDLQIAPVEEIRQTLRTNKIRRKYVETHILALLQKNISAWRTINASIKKIGMSLAIDSFHQTFTVVEVKCAVGQDSLS